MSVRRDSIRSLLLTTTLVLLLGCEHHQRPAPPKAESAADEVSEAQTADDEPPLEDQLLTLGSEVAEQLGLGRMWEGDLDGMVERRLIRVLVAYSKTYYFLDGARQRGVTYDIFEAFEDWLNEELGTGNIEIHVAMIPVRRDRLLLGVAEELGDVAAAGMTVTSAR